MRISREQQVPLTEDSRKYTTVNTHQYNRLPFGIASAPGTFQRTMESLLQDILHVCVYLDDILVTGPSNEAHLKTLRTVRGVPWTSNFGFGSPTNKQEG